MNKNTLKKIFWFWLKYTFITLGFIGLTQFWDVSIQKTGFWNFVIGYSIYIICNSIFNSVDKHTKNSENE